MAAVAVVAARSAALTLMGLDRTPSGSLFPSTVATRNGTLLHLLERAAAHNAA